MSKAKKVVQCYLCGVALNKLNKTVDHIPPQGLFPKERKNCNLITVPCCLECNRGHSGHDEMLLLMCGDLRNQISAPEIEEKVLTSAKRGGLRPHIPGILANSLRFPGYDLVRAPKHKQEAMIRMVKGLLYKFHCVRDFNSYHFWVAVAPLEARDSVVKGSKGHLARSVSKGDGIFRVDWMMDPASKSSMWWLQFYGGPVYWVICTTEAGSGGSTQFWAFPD